MNTLHSKSKITRRHHIHKFYIHLNLDSNQHCLAWKPWKSINRFAMFLQTFFFIQLSSKCCDGKIRGEASLYASEDLCPTITVIIWWFYQMLVVYGWCWFNWLGQYGLYLYLLPANPDFRQIKILLLNLTNFEILNCKKGPQKSPPFQMLFDKGQIGFCRNYLVVSLQLRPFYATHS